MSTMPGAVVIPQNYSEAMVLYTATDQVEAVVDGARPGKNGRLFVIEPGKPIKVPYEAGRFILEHLGYTGVVRVNETESDEGVKYDVEGAKVESLEKSRVADHQRFQQYISSAVEDYVKRNKPVPQPDAAILKIIERRGYDLKRFGIVPIGWEEPEKDKRVTQVESENSLLKTQLAELSAKVDELTAKKKKD